MKKTLHFTLFLFLSLWVHATQHIITNSGNTFSPSNLQILEGDTIIFNLQPSQNVIEVSQATYNANGNTPLPGGFSLTMGGGMLTDVQPGLHYYVSGPQAASGMKGVLDVISFPPPIVYIPNVWINEIHYDNAGTDTLEGFEIAGTSGVNLNCFNVYLYNGNDSLVYDTINLSGTIPNQSCNFGAVWFPLPSGGLQNGPRDGIVLAFEPLYTGCGQSFIDTILEFISYEGTLRAKNGRADGMNSVDIFANEAGTTPIGNSIQVTNTPVNGSQANLRVWCGPKPSTYGLLNAGQNFCTPSAPGTFRFFNTSITVNESAGTVVAGYVQLTNARAFSNTVEVQLSVPGSDLTVTTSPVTITLCGNDTVPFSINIIDDLIFEGPEAVLLKLRNPSPNNVIGADSTFTVNIVDNDLFVPTPVVSFGSASASQLENITSYTLPITLASANSNPTSVTISLTGGTANNPADFTFSPTTVTFPANSTTTQNVTITVVNDALFEANETAIFELINLTNGALKGADSVFTFTILNDEAVPVDPIVKMTSTSATVNESAATYNLAVSILNQNSNATSVTIEAISGTATAGSDYTFAATTVTFPANSSTNQTATVTIVNDAVFESTENVVFVLRNATNNASIDADSSLSLTINDNDAPLISIVSTSTSVNEDEGEILVDVNLTNTSTSNVTVVLSATGTATSGVDYSYSDTTITWTAGNNGTVSIPLVILDDTICGETIDTITLTLTSPSSGAVLGTSTIMITIIDNDTCIFITPYGECLNLYFSEYIEGSSNNKALEIYNPTASSIDLSGYFLAKKSNGTTLTSFALSGTVAAGDVFVIANPSSNAAILAAADVTNSFINFNGDDAVYLLQGIDTIDVMGDFRNYAGASGWTVGSGGTQNSTLVRNAYVYYGDTLWADAVGSWLVFPQDVTDSLGAHTQMTCGAEPPVGQAMVDFDTINLSALENFGVLNIDVVVSNTDLNPVTFDIAIDGGTAINSTDYTLTTLNFSVPANTNQTIPVAFNIINDLLTEGNETAILKITNLSSNAVSTDSVITVTIIDNEVGITEVSTVNINVWPNPASDNVMIHATEKISFVEIFNLQGEIVKTIEGKTKSLIADVKELAAGMYTIKVATAAGNGYKRIILAD